MDEKTFPRELHTLKPIALEVGQYGATWRRGDKWRGVPSGHRFMLTTGEDRTIFGEGRVFASSYCTFRNIPDFIIGMNHTGNYDYERILKAMQVAYGPEFNEDEEVAIVIYERWR